MTSLQRLSIQSVAQFLLPFGRNLKGARSQIGGGVGGSDFRQSKANPRIPNIFHYKVLLYLPPYRRNSTVKLRLPLFDPRFGRLGWTYVGVENGTNRNLVPTFIFDIYITLLAYLPHLATIHNAADRHRPHRTIGIGLHRLLQLNHLGNQWSRSYDSVDKQQVGS